MIDESILNALRMRFSTSIHKIRIPSIDGNREFSFREPNVREVNTISKVILSNSDAKSTVYASTLAFMKILCLDNDFEPQSMNELDRIKVLTYILSGIFFSKNLTIRCPRVGCNTTFPFSLKYGDMLEKMDKASSMGFEFSNETEVGKIKIEAGFPSVSRYLGFLEFVDGIRNVPVDYKSFNDSFVEIDSTSSRTDGGMKSGSDDSFVEKIRKRREILKNKIKDVSDKGNSLAGNVDIKRNDGNSRIEPDMAPLYIKNMLITGIPGSEDDYSIDFSGLSYEDSVNVMDIIPMRLLIKDNGDNFIKSIYSEVKNALNSCAPEIICPTCGHNISKKMGVQNFFIHG